MKAIQLSIPGKVMLAGEYAVLRGGHSLAATINRTLTVTANVESDMSGWTITSNIWPEPIVMTDLRAPQTDPLCRAVQAGAKRYGFNGGTVDIKSNLNIQDGVGSSAALRLGVCAAFHILKHDFETKRTSGIAVDALQHAWALQTESQGMASGYDVVTQYVGGLVEFNYEFVGNTWKPHWFKHDVAGLSDLVHVFVGGNGAPTTTTMQTTSSWLESSHRYERLIEASESLIDAFLTALRWPTSQHYQSLFAMTAAHRTLFAGNPHFPVELAQALVHLPGHDTKWSWKTTGAGGEDAILILGPLSHLTDVIKALAPLGWRRLDAEFTNQGIQTQTAVSSPLPPKPATRKLVMGAQKAAR